MKHSYFLKTLDWKAAGDYYDDKGRQFPLNGEVSILKTADQWTLTGFLEVMFDVPSRFTNDYHIYAASDETTLEWVSVNPALGTLKGTIEFIENSIISNYCSEDGRYRGAETLVQTEEHAYYNVGVTFFNGKKMSSWTSTLTAQEK